MLLSRRQVREIVTLSFAHLSRLEAEGKFPKRLRLTEHPNGRVAWVKSEVEEWIAQRIAKRTP